MTVREDRVKDGSSTKIGVRAARALTGLSLSVASVDTLGSDRSTRLSIIARDVPIFSTGLPIALPATVGPLVGVDGTGRTGGDGEPFFVDASNFNFGFTDSGALT